jgi:hypothetical protein
LAVGGCQRRGTDKEDKEENGYEDAGEVNPYALASSFNNREFDPQFHTVLAL